MVAGRNELIKNADYSDVIMGVSGVFNLRTQFNDALIASRNFVLDNPGRKIRAIVNYIAGGLG